MGGAPRGGHALRREPRDQRGASGARGVAAAQVLAQLRPVIRDSPTVPGILRPGVRRHAAVWGDMVHAGKRDIRRRPWERPGGLAEHAEHGTSPARSPMLGLDQRPCPREHRPMFASFLRLPRTLQTLWPPPW